MANTRARATTWIPVRRTQQTGRQAPGAMSSMAPRGPLPARVYWVRRTLVLVVALALVFGIGKLLTGFGGDPKATTAAAVPTRTRAADG